MGFNVGAIAHISAPGAAAIAASTAIRTTLAGSSGSLAAVVVARCQQKTGPLLTQIWSLEAACKTSTSVALSAHPDLEPLNCMQWLARRARLDHGVCARRG